MVLSNKIIETFPKNYSYSPYNLNDFNKKTKDFCTNFKYNGSNIKSAKVILLGDVAVGKTCLVNCFCHQLFDFNYKTTIGVDFEIELIQILGVPFHLQIWDTAGQERFKCIAQSYYRSANAIVIICDLSKINTLQSCTSWLTDALQVSSTNPYVFLIGTKKDLLSPASFEEAEQLAINMAKIMNAEYWSVSSKTGENVKNVFLRISALLFNALILKEEEKRDILIASNDVISLKKNKSKKHHNLCCNI